jgi:dTDP-4-amino-4,6-dideoxygalactose transaminase
MKKIPFNKPYLTGKEAHYIYQAVYSGKISGNGQYTQICQNFFMDKYGFKKTLLTTSCTDALEMSAILVGIQPGDEVIVPSYTFVSTALLFTGRGRKLYLPTVPRKIPTSIRINLRSLLPRPQKPLFPYTMQV